ARRPRALRAFRPARGLSPRLEHFHLQFRTARGAGIPDRERAVLARAFSRRRAARRRRRLDALPRLQPARRRVDPQRLRRPRESRGGGLPSPPPPPPPPTPPPPPPQPRTNHPLPPH